MTGTPTTPDVGQAFSIDGECVGVSPLGRGHIQDTYVATFALPGGTRRRFLLQRINPAIFPDPRPLMENIVRVTACLSGATADLPGGDRPWREVLRVVPARDGRVWYHDGREGGIDDDDLGTPHPGNARAAAWRLYHFVEAASPYQEAPDPAVARRAAAVFGAFQRHLGELDPASLHETLPRFHDLGHRLEQFESAIGSMEDTGLRDGASSEIAFTHDRGPRLDARLHRLEGLGLPTRVVHDDCKLNNVLFDDETGEVACVVDLDTVMPGHVLFDFGDMVRTMTCPAAEDERDLDRVRVDLGLVEAVAAGYVSEARPFLTAPEVESLSLAGEYMAFLIGLRFLTDHLAGDVYFKTQRPGQNLDRARAQFRLVERLEDVADEVASIIQREVAGEGGR